MQQHLRRGAGAKVVEKSRATQLKWKRERKARRGLRWEVWVWSTRRVSRVIWGRGGRQGGAIGKRVQDIQTQNTRGDVAGARGEEHCVFLQSLTVSRMS